MNRRRHLRFYNRRHKAYAGAVYVAGAATLLVVALTARVPQLPVRWAVIVSFLALFVVLGELLPIAIRRGDTVELYTFSTTAALAFIIVGPIWIAVAALLSAAFLRDELGRKRPLFRNLFNLARCSISLVAARVVYHAVSHQGLLGHFTPRFEPRDLGPALLAGLAYFSINVCLVACVFALHQGAPAFSLLPEFVKSEGPMGLTLLAVGPIVLLALEFSPFTAPLCLVPVLAVRAGALGASKRELQALHDQLTGLPNRMLLLQRARRALASVTEEAMAAVILIDLDRFKEINDAMGHPVGDQLLRQVAAKLSGAARPGDTIARLGGDEFAVLCEGVPDEGSALEIGHRIVAQLTGLVELEGVNLRVEASAGVALSPLHARDVDSLLQRADIALYRAKGSRRGSVMLYDERFDDTSIERLTLMGQLCKGLEDELVVFYQPKCRLSDGAIVGVEALVRWQHPALGLLPPARFLDAAEKSGLILPLTVQVFRQVLRQGRCWQADGLDLSVAVNVSATSICDPTLPAELARVFEEFPSPTRRLLVEVTETSTVTDPDAANRVLAQLREIGLDISIDDFGTGHSSLAHIRDLGPVEVKIDRSFVAASTESERDLALIRAATELGHGLGMVVVAEGVETAEQLELVADVGCDLAQGFFILPPVTADEVASWAGRPHVWSRHIRPVLPVAASEVAES
jgi:diguanylate cyclase (GGDEF)-like protein